MSKVKELETLLSDQPQNPLRAHQIEAFQEEKARQESIVRAPAWQAGADRGAATKRFRQIDKYLREQAPKEMDAPRRDRVAKLADEVLAEIKDVMLPRNVMRRNPAGAVDAFRRGEGSQANKHRIAQWKRAMRAIDPQNTDRDYTNLERFRPEGISPDGTASFMGDAQIPGKFAMTPRAKENWPLGEPTVTNPLAQAREAEVVEATKPKRKPLSPEARRASIERLAAARAKKAALKDGIDQA